MYTVLIVFYVLVSLSLVGLVLIQHGKGADAGAAFGSGASGTVFGARGSANFLSRATAWLATLFFGLSLALAYVVHGREAPHSVVDTAPPAAKVEVPAPVLPPPAPAGPKTDAASSQAPAAAPAQPKTDAAGVTPPAAANPDAGQAPKPKVPN